MSRLEQLQAANTHADLAALLGFRVAKLTYVLYGKAAPAKFTTFEISKKSGGTRTIEAPNSALKLIQRQLSTLLQDCDEEIRQKCGRHDEGPAPDTVVHGFVRRRSIVTNAYVHRCRRFVFNVDLDDFFPSINFGRVRGFFIRDRNFSLKPAVATVIAQIACSGNHLPQGSPCSPVIANLIGRILDAHLVRLARRNGCRYTRYADDLTFSSNKREFPAAIGVRLDQKPHEWSVGTGLSRIVSRCGFRVNVEKTRMQYRDSRQEVTGLIVNEKVNVPNDYRRTVRAMVHRLCTTGTFEISNRAGVLSGANPGPNGGVAMLHGALAFIDSIDLYNFKESPSKGAYKLSSKELTYRKFLLYKDFYAAARPVLVCEGKTDTVYLTHAIRSLATSFPQLARVDRGGKVTLRIRRYRYADRSTGRILGLGGGHGDLKNLLNLYRGARKMFTAPRVTNPVILLVDNDDAARSMLSIVREITGASPDRGAPFLHVVDNWYVVLTPLPSGATESTIEDFFDASTKAIEFMGKSFDPSNGFSTKTHYGKADFAYNVVRPNAETIDFSGFEPLLRNLSHVIDDYAKRSAP